MKGNKDLLYDYSIPHPIFGIPKNYKQIKNYMEGAKMKIKVEESVKLTDGKHDGKIEDVEYRTTPQGYKYTDVVLLTEEQGKEVKVKGGYATKITKDTALGQLLERFGAKLEIGKDTDPDEFLTKGKEVSFQTVTKDKFYNIVPESLKPK